MYHKESGTGNDPFLAGNMLCRRRSLSPLRISALINLLRLFSIRERETYHLATGDARSLWQVSRAHSALSGCRRLEISREMLLGKIDMRPYESRPLPERDKKIARAIVIAVYERRKASSFGELQQNKD